MLPRSHGSLLVGAGFVVSFTSCLLQYLCLLHCRFPYPVKTSHYYEKMSTFAVISTWQHRRNITIDIKNVAL
jgi:hypothetical protein